MGVKGGPDPDFTSWSELLSTLMCACNPIASVQYQRAARAAKKKAAGAQPDSVSDSDSDDDLPTCKDLPLPPSSSFVSAPSFSGRGVLQGRSWNLILPFEDIKYVLDPDFIGSLLKMTNFNSEVYHLYFSFIIIIYRIILIFLFIIIFFRLCPKCLLIGVGAV